MVVLVATTVCSFFGTSSSLRGVWSSPLDCHCSCSHEELQEKQSSSEVVRAVLERLIRFSIEHLVTCSDGVIGE